MRTPIVRVSIVIDPESGAARFKLSGLGTVPAFRIIGEMSRDPWLVRYLASFAEATAKQRGLTTAAKIAVALEATLAPEREEATPLKINRLQPGRPGWEAFAATIHPEG